MSPERPAGSDEGPGRESADTSGKDESQHNSEAFRRHWKEVREHHEPQESARSTDQGVIFKLRHAQSAPLLWLRMGLVIVASIILIGSILYVIAGTWPLVVGIESGSMEPHIAQGDIVVLSAPGRFASAQPDTDSGVVTYRTGKAQGYRSFGTYGSVVVFRNPDGGEAIIHRVHFQVTAGENWLEQANQTYVNGESCADIKYCPAPYDGFITKGDANSYYDQVAGIAPPVRSEWVIGVGQFRIPLWVTHPILF